MWYAIIEWVTIEKKVYLFFTDEMLEKLMTYTNNSIKPAMERFSNFLKEIDKYLHFQKVGKIDILAFIRLLYLHSAFRLNLCETVEIWNHKSSHNIFSKAMPYNQFQFILKFIPFDNKSTCNNQWIMDKFACLWELFKLNNEQNGKCRFPSLLLTVDETL